MNKFKISAALFSASIAGLLTGCGSEVNPYDHIQNEVDIYEYTRDAAAGGSTFHETMANYLFFATDNMKAVAPFIMIGSWLICILIFALVRNEQRLRKIAVFTFGITIPLLTFVMVYVLAYLTGLFL